MHRTTNPVPEAFVCYGRNRLKIYDGKVYLKDRQEFSIEFFNPTKDTIGAKIYLNGNSISDRKIVLRPGERSYLERYIDDARKFTFNTYEVGSSDAVKKATEDNGKFRVEFFKEQQHSPIFYSGSGTITVPYYNPYNPFTCTTGGVQGPTGAQGVTGATTTNCFYSATGTATSSCDFTSDDILSRSPIKLGKKVETGRAEKGSSSGQSLDTYNGDFDWHYFAVTEYKLLPESAKDVETSSIRSYCPGCRNRIRKSSWRYCPACGEEL